MLNLISTVFKKYTSRLRTLNMVHRPHKQNRKRVGDPLTVEAKSVS